MYIDRQISKQLKEASEQFPVVFLTGPRQSGKTTVLKKIFPDFSYVNLEDPEIRLWAIEQPRDFLDNNPWPLIIDEAQYAPDLFSYIQGIVDEYQKQGMFLLSGSQNFLLMEKITQSLAGRSAVLTLFPLSFQELSASELELNIETNQFIMNGFFPRIYHSIKDVSLFYKSYSNTYVERDVRQLANIGSMNDFIRFMCLCAGRSGQLLNISSLSSEAGIAYNTCKYWLSYLRTAYIIEFLQPYYKNFNKKIIKAPKIYFCDTGLLCHLLGINSRETLALHPLRGAIFENLVFNELLKNNLNRGNNESIWFWRDNHGTEIDFILEKDTNISAIEVKSSVNFHDEYLKNLRKFMKYNPEVRKMYLIYDGRIERQKENIHILNWKSPHYLY
jgi:uncharacterized protein